MTSNGGMDRLAMVRDLLNLSKPAEIIMKQLALMDWDYEGGGVELTKMHLNMALQRYIRGELSSSEVEFWANQIEGREDIQLEASSAREIEYVLYELANPTLTQSLSSTRAEELIEKLF